MNTFPRFFVIIPNFDSPTSSKTVFVMVMISVAMSAATVAGPVAVRLLHDNVVD